MYFLICRPDEFDLNFNLRITSFRIYPIFIAIAPFLLKTFFYVNLHCIIIEPIPASIESVGTAPSAHTYSLTLTSLRFAKLTRVWLDFFGHQRSYTASSLFLFNVYKVLGCTALNSSGLLVFCKKKLYRVGTRDWSRFLWPVSYPELCSSLVFDHLNPLKFLSHFQLLRASVRL